MKKFLFLMPSWFGSSYLGILSILSYVSNPTYLQAAAGNFEKLEESIKAFQPDIIGFYSSTVDFPAAVALAQRLRSGGFNGLLAIGGHHVSPLPTSIDGTPFDIAIRGDGEPIVEPLIGGIPTQEINGIYIEGKESVGARLSSSVLPALNYDLFPPTMCFQSNIIWTLMSRGCPHRCRFCSTEFEKSYRLLSIDKIIKQITSALKYGTGLGIWDDVFVGKSRIKSIIDALEEEGLLDKIEFTHIHARTSEKIDAETWDLWKCLKVTNLNIGYESGSNKVLKYLKNSEKVSVENHKKNTLKAKSLGLNCNGSFMFGSPGETLEDMRMTLDFMRWCQRAGLGKFWYYVANPYPGTEFWKIAQEKGKVNDKMDFSTLDLCNYQNPLLLDASVSFEEYMGVIREAQRITGDWFVPDHRKRSRMTGAMGKLTIVILTKNNENYIRHTLENVKDLGVRILVCDTGSTDRTVEIVQEYGIRVEYIHWEDDFAAARNAALSFVETPWALYVDSDMQVTFDFQEIWGLLESKEYDGWRLPHRYFADLERTKVLWPDSYPSLNPKLLRVDGAVRWHGRLHEGFKPESLVGRAEAPHLDHFDRAVKTPEQLEATHQLYDRIRSKM